MISWFFISLVMTILLTPGPTNTLLASSGIESGMQKSLKLIPAEVTGYFISISAWGLLIESVSASFAFIPPLLKLISASYIVFLACKLWKTSTHNDINQTFIRPSALFVATLLNPKALLFASAVFPASSWSNLNVYLIHMATFLGLITPIAVFWIFLGSILVSNRISWLNQKNLKRAAAMILISFSIPLSYSAFSAL